MSENAGLGQKILFMDGHYCEEYGMFGIGMPEMLLILAVALLVIGPKKLPDLAKSLGRALGEFKRATSDFKESLEIDSELKDVRKTFDDVGRDLSDQATSSLDPADALPKSPSPPPAAKPETDPNSKPTEVPPENE
jgi:TatA/E family protein of Tat protein translocase